MANARQSQSPAAIALPEVGWIRALGHPWRMQILEVLDCEVESPNRLSQRLSISLGNVSYHVRELFKAGCIERVATRPVRGTSESFYRSTPHSTFAHPLWENIPKSLRGRRAVEGLERFLHLAISAIEAEATDDDQTVFAWTPIAVDDAGHKEATKVLLAAQADIERISGESLDRLGANKRNAVQLIVGVASFKAEPTLQQDAD